MQLLLGYIGLINAVVLTPLLVILVSGLLSRIHRCYYIVIVCTLDCACPSC
jgi:hypothetical protein